MIYVAVVCKLWEPSGRAAGDWACFINKQKSQAIRAAITARKKWYAAGKYGPYKILVGTLTEEVKLPPAKFELQPITVLAAKCTCPPYYAKEDASLADFCPLHGINSEINSFDELNV